MVTQSDVDTGQIANTGTGDSNETDPIDDQLDTPVAQSASLDTVKVLSTNADEDNSGDVSLDDTLTYTVTVTNTGNVTLTGVTATDTLITPSSESCASVAPGDTCVLTGTYVVTQSDVDTGQIANTGTGDSNETDPIDDQLDTPVAQSASLTIDKTQSSGPNPATADGDVLGYTIVVTNTGSVSQTGVNVSDTLPDGSAGTLSGPTESITADGVLEVNETWTYTVDYTVTQADIDAGADLVNSVEVETNEVPGPTGDTATTPVNADAAIAIVKTGIFNDDNGDGVAQVGETISYAFEVTNTGNVLLTNVAVTDPLLTVNGGPLASLDVGASDAATFSGSYTLTQADVDAGQVINQATVTAEAANGNRVSDISDDNSPAENDPTVTPLGPGPVSPVPVPSGSWWMMLVLLAAIAATGRSRLTRI